MPSDLNDAINGLFRGIIFIFYSYFASLGKLLLFPVKASLQLVRGLWSKRPYQTQPYVFLFLSLFIAQAVPRYLASIVNYYKDDFPASSGSVTAFQSAYTTAVRLFDPKAVVAITISCLIMSVLVDGIIGAYLLLILKRRLDRKFAKPAMIYIVGVQAFILTAALVGVFLYFRGWAWSSLEEYKQSQFLSEYRGLFDGVIGLEHGWDLWLSLGVLVLGCAAIFYALSLPVIAASAFASGKRLIGWRRRLPKVARIALALLILVPAALGYVEAGNWVEDQIAPVKPEDPIVSEVTCFLGDGNPPVLRAVAVIANPSDTPLLIRPFDTELHLAAERDPSLPQEPAKYPSGRPRKLSKYSNTFMKATITNSGQGIDKPAYLVPSGQSLWVESTAVQTVFPKGVGDNLLHCGVTLPNFFQLKPIEGFGNVITPKDQGK